MARPEPRRDARRATSSASTWARPTRHSPTPIPTRRRRRPAAIRGLPIPGRQPNDVSDRPVCRRSSTSGRRGSPRGARPPSRRPRRRRLRQGPREGPARLVASAELASRGGGRRGVLPGAHDPGRPSRQASAAYLGHLRDAWNLRSPARTPAPRLERQEVCSPSPPVRRRRPRADGRGGTVSDWSTSPSSKSQAAFYACRAGDDWRRRQGRRHRPGLRRADDLHPIVTEEGGTSS